MPAIDSAALVVARFLRANNYNETYQAFIDEASLPQDAGDASPDALTLEKLLEEKRLYDQSVNFEKLSLTDNTPQGWSVNAPSTPTVIDALPGRANMLNVFLHNDEDGDKIYASTSDRKINVINVPELTLDSTWSGSHDSPVLAQVTIQQYHISASMSGALLVSDRKSGEVLEQHKDHNKYIVALAVFESNESHLLASAGWDNKIVLYTVNDTRDGILHGPVARLTLQTKPESIAFTRHPDSGQAVLIVTRTDSSHLYFYTVDGSDLVLLGQQNLAPHSNAWVAFTPTSIDLHPSDNIRLAVATNSTPHMKLLVVKLLIPPLQAVVVQAQTPREEAMRQQAISDKEYAAIELHCNTMSAQTLYSSPLVKWRPDGCGVWVNSDDGIIRGLDILSGKVVAELRGHDGGTKVRTLWTGKVGGEQSERLISGGFDHKLIIWTP